MEAVLDVLQQTDEALAAEAAREGSDGPAFVALVERFRQRVWRICYRLLGNEADAHDAAQEVFVRLFLHRPSSTVARSTAPGSTRSRCARAWPFAAAAAAGKNTKTGQRRTVGTSTAHRKPRRPQACRWT